jgi:16S rRNA processing protein RimM
VTAPFAELVTIGTVVKPQGRRGEVAVAPLSDRPDRFAELRRAFVPGPDGSSREVQVESAWPHKGRFVVKLAGVDSIDEAERYRGLDLRIPESELEPLPEGSYYHHQLKGLAVVDPSGTEWGRVADLLETGAATVLVIRGEGGETLLPLAERFVSRVDVAGGRLLAARPEYVEAK